MFAKILLHLGKDLGLSVVGNETVNIDKLVQLEDRDRLAKNVRGAE